MIDQSESQSGKCECPSSGNYHQATNTCVICYDPGKPNFNSETGLCEASCSGGQVIEEGTGNCICPEGEMLIKNPTDGSEQCGKCVAPKLRYVDGACECPVDRPHFASSSNECLSCKDHSDGGSTRPWAWMAESERCELLCPEGSGQIFKVPDLEPASKALVTGPRGSCVCPKDTPHWVDGVCINCNDGRPKSVFRAFSQEPSTSALLEEQHVKQRRFLRSTSHQNAALLQLSRQMLTKTDQTIPGRCVCPPDRENFAQSINKCVETCKDGAQWNDQSEQCEVPCDTGMHFDASKGACVCDPPTRMGVDGLCQPGCPASRPVSKPEGGCRRRYAEDCRKIGKVLPDPVTQECRGQFTDATRIKWSREVCKLYLEGKITWRQLSNIVNDIVTANGGKIPKSMKGGTGALENRITETDGYKQVLKNWLTSKGDSKAVNYGIEPRVDEDGNPYVTKLSYNTWQATCNKNSGAPSSRNPGWKCNWLKKSRTRAPFHSGDANKGSLPVPLPRIKPKDAGGEFWVCPAPWDW